MFAQSCPEADGSMTLSDPLADQSVQVFTAEDRAVLDAVLAMGALTDDLDYTGLFDYEDD